MTKRKVMMMDARSAASHASAYLQDLFSDAQLMQVEEVEISDDRSYWYITLSFVDRESMALPTYPTPRKYKIFKIDADTGEVVSMKIRKI